MKILIYGYGNPGRQDDGLGIAFVSELEKWTKLNNIQNIDFDSNYQLNIEDAELISHYDKVYFADATIEENIKEFTITKLDPSEATIEFTMHAVSPAFVLDLCHKIYNKTPDTYLIHIKGYEWDLKESLTPQAANNLEKAINFMKNHIFNLINKKQ